MNMKKSTIWKSLGIFAIMMLGYTTLNAQNPSPATVTLDGSTFGKHGFNSGGIATTLENVDSLTIGAANVKYFVYPDSAISPLYNVATNYSTGLNSDFFWSVNPSTGITIDTTNAGYRNNYAKITFPSTGTPPIDYTISVVETAKGSNCAGTAKAINARLIAIPAVTGGTVTAPGCPSTVAPYNFLVPTISLTGLSSAVQSTNQKIKITYTLTGPTDMAGTIGTLNTNTIDIPENSTSVDLSGLGPIVDYPGTYTFSITGISDRISRKSGVAVTPSFTNVTFVVSRRPVTGTIYHLPNN
jgi:hypothetical protein